MTGERGGQKKGGKGVTYAIAAVVSRAGGDEDTFTGGGRMHAEDCVRCRVSTVYSAAACCAGM